MRKLMEAMISEGLVQVALDAQDVFKGGGWRSHRTEKIESRE